MNALTISALTKLPLKAFSLCNQNLLLNKCEGIDLIGIKEIICAIILAAGFHDD